MLNEPNVPNEPSSPKEMLGVSKDPDGKTHVRINFSSLDLVQTCLRKAYYALDRGLRPTTESEATCFGRAVHAALEVWYCSPRANRTKTATRHCDDYQALMLGGNDATVLLQVADHGPCVRCASAAQFLETSAPICGLPENDKRSQANGLAILSNYFDHYADDPFVVATDAYGPLCERRFEFLLSENDERRITYFGTVDTVLRNEHTGIVLVCDHKTTATLGSEFLNRIKPNFQYCGYVMGAQRVFGLTTSAFMANGIQVAKTVRNLSRQVVQYAEDDFAELTMAVEYSVDEFLRAKERAAFPMRSPTPCSLYGACTYKAVCEVPKKLREAVIGSLYETTNKGESS